MSPRRSVPGSSYPPDWKAIAKRIKDEAGWRCVRCNAAPDLPRISLGIHHLDMNPSNSAWWNLIPLCSPCHLHIQSKVDLNRPWVMAEHSAWFKPYVAGWYAYRYLGISLTREEVMTRLDELLGLERQAVLA